MEEKQSRSSRFAGLPGILLLLVLAVTAIYFNAQLVGAFLSLLALLFGCSFVWSREVLKKAEISAEPLKGECCAGETLLLEMKVKNKSFFPLIWLDVILPMGKRPLARQAGQEDFSWHFLKGNPEAQIGIRERFVWLLWQQEIGWQEELSAVRRGVITLEGAGLRAGDGFGLSAQESWYPFETPVRLIIYPRITAVSARPFLKICQEAAARDRGQQEDVTVLKSSRPYQPGDSVKRINWRILAGSGRMEINLYEQVMPGCMTFLLDLESFRRVTEEENSQGMKEKKIVLLEQDLEQMISLAASCMKAIEERHIPTALVIPAYGGREAFLGLPGEGESILRFSLEALAELDYQAQEVRFPYEEFWQRSHSLGNIHICTRSDSCSGLDGLAELLGRSRVRYLVLKRDNGSEGEFEYLYREDL